VVVVVDVGRVDVVDVVEVVVVVRSGSFELSLWEASIAVGETITRMIDSGISHLNNVFTEQIY